MSRGIVIVLRTILFCVLANVVCGSQHYYWSNARTRNPRYASCPTCHRDCPDALSSPWYPRQSYGEVSANRKYRGSDGGSYGEWIPSGSLSSFYPRGEYGRSTRSGSANPTEIASSGTGNPHRHRGSFEDRQLRRIDPYLASKPSTAQLSQGNTPNSYPFVPMTNSLINSNYEKRSYQPRRFVQESVDRSANFQTDPEYDNDRSNRLRENSYRNRPIESSSVPKDVEEEEEEEEEEVDYPKVSPEKFLVVYRADGDARPSFESEEEDTLPFERSDSADVSKESKLASRLEGLPEPFAPVDLNSFLERRPSREEELVDSREAFGASEMIREPEIRRGPYDLSPRSNNAKMTQRVQKDSYSKRDEHPVALWQDDKEWSREETDKSLESPTHDDDYYVSSIDDDFAKGSTKNVHKDAPDNEEEKLLAEHALKITQPRADDAEEGSLKFDPDFMEDIENPPVEPTEPTPTSETTETSMTSKHSR
ncbi:hypothetical protein KPH14_009398 [Odynerus spinipes]|uniref:Uncharacterized protein n=1 Tax=Odynerus spinipes TaxID=1348599 RepID=A0AAD9VQI9_9HYME|nr:hypothetical protein KPH14_009398 [Odynerus spinipes]